MDIICFNFSEVSNTIFWNILLDSLMRSRLAIDGEADWKLSQIPGLSNSDEHHEVQFESS